VLAFAACTSSASRGGTGSTTTSTISHSSTGPSDPSGLAADAYIWGSPLVITERTLQTFGNLLGINHLYWQTALSDPSSRVVVAPNVDTLYSVAVLDLRAGPVMLTVPRITDRYYTFQFIDAWTNSFAYVGTRATGGRSGTWLVSPPGWRGTVPSGAHQLVAPTAQVFLLGRFLVKDAADVVNVQRLHATVALAPLGRTGAGARTPGTPRGSPVAVATQDASFYDELGDALGSNAPATDADRAALARFASLGIGPGRHPFSDGSPAARDLLTRGVARGEAAVTAAARSQSRARDGWTIRLDIGTYTDVLVRAVVARVGWGANVPQEAVYASSDGDGDGHRYDGTQSYVMHFAPGALPPVRAFWSLTLYGPTHFLVENSLHRYAIGDRTPTLAHNADGSLDLYIGHAAPRGHEGNWLPAPAGPFLLSLRMYLPSAPILEGRYLPPPVRRVR